MMRSMVRAALSALALVWQAPAPARIPKVGEAAPDFRLETLDGATLSLAELRGQVVVLNLWATWCAPCKVELPQLDAYYRLHRNEGLRVFALATENSVPLFRLRPLASVMAVPWCGT